MGSSYGAVKRFCVVKSNFILIVGRRYLEGVSSGDGCSTNPNVRYRLSDATSLGLVSRTAVVLSNPYGYLVGLIAKDKT
jgi:hypothetical protein